MPISARDSEAASGISNRIFPLAVGNNASFVFVATMDRSADVHHYRLTFNVLRRERITLNGRAHETFVISRTEEGLFNNTYLGHMLYWIDTETLLPVKQQQRIERGLAQPIPEWVATRTGGRM
jgi:hypothetical protein